MGVCVRGTLGCCAVVEIDTVASISIIIDVYVFTYDYRHTDLRSHN